MRDRVVMLVGSGVELEVWGDGWAEVVKILSGKRGGPGNSSSVNIDSGE